MGVEAHARAPLQRAPSSTTMTTTTTVMAGTLLPRPLAARALDDDDFPDGFVENAWREAMQHTWREYAGAAGGDVLRLALANDAFRRIAKVRGSCLSM